jgi:hypothetical protein
MLLILSFWCKALCLPLPHKSSRALVHIPTVHNSFLLAGSDIDVDTSVESLTLSWMVKR